MNNFIKLNNTTSISNIFYIMMKNMIGKKVTIKDTIETWDGSDFKYQDVTGILKSVNTYIDDKGGRTFYFEVNGQQHDVTNSFFTFI